MPASLIITELASELRIRIRHTERSEIPVAIFLLIWLTGWFFGEAFAWITLFGHSTPVPVRLFFLVWLIPWTAGGVFALLTVAKMIGGYELIEVGRGMLRVTRSFMLFRFTRNYDIFKITDLHSLAKNPRKLDLFRTGLFQFRYEGKDEQFGSALSPQGKTDIMKALRAHRDMSDRNFR